jgi:hypothetical protein
MQINAPSRRAVQYDGMHAYGPPENLFRRARHLAAARTWLTLDEMALAAAPQAPAGQRSGAARRGGGRGGDRQAGISGDNRPLQCDRNRCAQILVGAGARKRHRCRN